MKLNTPRNTTQYSLGRTSTFRAASSALFKAPWFDGFGTNLQNIEASMRAIYIPDDGYELAQADQSGAEALIVAYLCKPAKYRDLFLNKVNPHCFLALHMFHEKWRMNSEFDIDGILKLEPKTIAQHGQYKEIFKYIKSSDEWPSNARYYYFSKQANHSANYGIRWPAFQMNILEKSGGKVALSKKDSEYILSFYRTMYPEIPAWNYETMKCVSKTRTLFNLFGHPRYFHGVQNDAFFREAYAFVPQSTVGEITHIAFRDMQQYIEKEKKDWHLLANTHDSYLLEYPPAEREECHIKMKEYLEQWLTSPSGDKFQMRSEIKYGNNWAFKS